MTDFLSVAADKFRDQIFLEDVNGSLTFAQTEHLVARGAAELGDRTGEQMIVRPALDIMSVLELLASLRSGATAVLGSRQLPEERTTRMIGLAASDRRPSHTILFTSGSTGIPRGVRFSASNWEAAAKASTESLGHGEGDRWLCPLPLHHVGGLSIIFRSMIAGGRAVLAADLDEVGARLRSVQLASVVPTQLRRLLARKTSFDGSPKVLVGGGPVADHLLGQAADAGLAVLPTYGMTETTGQVATARPDDPRRRLFPLPGIEIRIGEGEIIEVKGPTVTLGYVGEAERDPLQWFRTADLGAIDEDGSLRVMSRTDRAVISGGENIDPAEVEGVIASLPAILDVFVLGLPDDEWGQVVVAAYVGTASPRELSEAVKEKLTPAAVPRRWLQLDALPRDDLGKINQQALLALLKA